MCQVCVSDTDVRVCARMCGWCPSHYMLSHLLVVGTLTSFSCLSKFEELYGVRQSDIHTYACAYTHNHGGGELTLGFLCSAKLSARSSIGTLLWRPHTSSLWPPQHRSTDFFHPHHRKDIFLLSYVNVQKLVSARMRAQVENLSYYQIL